MKTTKVKLFDSGNSQAVRLAVRYERSNLSRGVHTGDSVSVQYGEEKSQVYERGQEPQHDRGSDAMQIEREHTLASS